MQETDSQSQEQATATKAASAPAKSRTLWGDAFKRLRKNKLAVIGVCWIIIVVVVALTADLRAKPWLGSPTASDCNHHGPDVADGSVCRAPVWHRRPWS